MSRSLCPVCGSEGRVTYTDCVDFYVHSPGTYEYLRCRGCGLLWISDPPSPDDLARLYNPSHARRE